MDKELAAQVDEIAEDMLSRTLGNYALQVIRAEAHAQALHARVQQMEAALREANGDAD